MKIGLTTSVIQRGQTGIARYVLALTQAMLGCLGRHQLYLFVLEEDLPLFESLREQVRLVPVAERHRPPLKNIVWHHTRLPRLARELQLDVLHVPSYRRMLWKRPCALVTTIHDLAPFVVPEKYDWARMFYGRVVARQLARRQHEIITISQSSAAAIARWFGVPPQRLTVIPNGVDHERFCPGPREEARAWVAAQYGVSAPFFLYTARLEHPAKNHTRLITAFNQFKAHTQSPWQLVFAGSDWHGAEVIHTIVRQSPYAADIRSLGFVPDESLPQLNRAAEVFVFPSLYEGFGLPPLEAMACGCPVISSSRGSLGEVVGNAAICVDPEDITSLKWEMERLAADPVLREQLSAAGIEQARQFDWQRSAQQTMEVYLRAVARSRSAKDFLMLPRQWRHGVSP